MRIEAKAKHLSCINSYVQLQHDTHTILDKRSGRENLLSIYDFWVLVVVVLLRFSPLPATVRSCFCRVSCKVTPVFLLVHKHDVAVAAVAAAAVK